MIAVREGTAEGKRRSRRTRRVLERVEDEGRFAHFDPRKRG